ncbi:MAG: hypothetical protein IJC50_02460 [Clostridia bacterium]|nr:hypothetical protein [Clostridia bacterium]
MGFNIQNLLETLPIMGKGMLGIFVVIGIIYFTMYIFGLISDMFNREK